MIERHMTKTNMAFPVVSVSGSTTDEMYGVSGFPASYLVDANGVVIWEGHPGSLRSEMLVSALKEAAYVHPLEGKEFSSLNKQLAGQNFGAAYKIALKELLRAPDDAELLRAKASLDSILEAATSKAGAYSESGEFGLAMDAYEVLAKNFKGHPGADDAKLAMKTLSKNPAAKEELAAHKKMGKGAAAQLAGDREQAIKVYEGVVKKYPDTKAAGRAGSYLSRHP